MIFLILHLISCAFMTGLIWTIQLLHYPAFAFVDKNQFYYFHSRHSKVITFIVAPVMLLELLTAILILVNFTDNYFLKINLVMLILTWICTAFLSVPVHNTLSKNWDLLQIRKLILTNWPRTFLWSLRLLFLTIFVLHYLGEKNVDFK